MFMPFALVINGHYLHQRGSRVETKVYIFNMYVALDLVLGFQRFVNILIDRDEKLEINVLCCVD
jgi:hypothetical protein